MDTPELPHLDPALVAALDQRFPEKCVDLTPKGEDPQFYAGKRWMVRFLQAESKAQSENILTRKERS